MASRLRSAWGMDFVIEETERALLLRPLSEAARLWIADNIPNAQYIGDAVVIDRGEAPVVLDEIRLDGLEAA